MKFFTLVYVSKVCAHPTAAQLSRHIGL